MLSTKRSDSSWPGALEVTQEGSSSAREGPDCLKGGSDPPSGPCRKGWISAIGDSGKRRPSVEAKALRVVVQLPATARGPGLGSLGATPLWGLVVVCTS